MASSSTMSILVIWFLPSHCVLFQRYGGFGAVQTHIMAAIGRSCSVLLLLVIDHAMTGFARSIRVDISQHSRRPVSYVPFGIIKGIYPESAPLVVVAHFASGIRPRASDKVRMTRTACVLTRWLVAQVQRPAALI